MTRLITIIILFTPFFTSADEGMPLVVALNEPDKLLEQRQAAVERLNKLLEQKRLGITPTAVLPVATQTPVVKPVEKIQKQQVAKAVSSETVQAIKKAEVAKKKLNVAVLAWGGALIDDHHFEREMSNYQMAEQMIKTVSENLDKVLKLENSYTKVINKDMAEAIVSEDGNDIKTKNICNHYKVDNVIAVRFSRYAINGSADVTLFNCANGLKKAQFFDLDTAFNDKYYLEKDFSKVLEKFYTTNIGLLSTPK